MSLREPSTEPVALPALIMSFVTAVLALLVGTGVIDTDVSAWILAIVAAAIPLVAYFVQRPKVTPIDQLPPPEPPEFP